MIVFSGPTISPSLIDYSSWLSEDSANIKDPILYDAERSIRPEELVHQKKVNVSDLVNITIDVLCSLQLLYNSNQTMDEWVWELSDANITTIVEALGLHGYVALSDVVVLPTWFKYLMTILFVGCMVFSVATNSRTIIAIGIQKVSWSSTNVLIAALALSDLLTVCCTTPTEIASVVYDLEVWEFGEIGCVLFPFLQSASILSNGLILCLIAYDRYICVVKLKPFTAKTTLTWAVVALIVSVWIISICITIPIFWLWRVYFYILVDDVPDPEIGVDFCSVFPQCVDNDNNSNSAIPIYYIILCGAIFIPLFFVFLILYCRIGYFLWLRSPVGSTNSSGYQQQLARKKQVAVALFWLVFAFFICRMPSWIFIIVTMFGEDVPFGTGMRMAKSSLMFLSVLNTALDPWLYSRLNEPLKKTLRSCSDRCLQSISIFDSCCHSPVPRSTSNDEEEEHDQYQQHYRSQRMRKNKIRPKEEQQDTDSSSSTGMNIPTISTIVYADLNMAKSVSTSQTESI